MAAQDHAAIPNWKPRIPIARQPDINVYSVNNDPLPTTMFTIPTYPALHTINWQSNIASVSSELSSLYYSSEPVQRNPAASATESPNFQIKVKGPSGIIAGVVSAISVLALICLGIGALLCVCRRRRKRLAAAQGQNNTREMTQSGSNTSTVAETRAYVQPPSSQQSATFHSLSTTTSFSTQQSRVPQPPVLLSTTMDQSYFTGIDTSDNMSLADSRRLSLASPPYTASLMEAPPPPYRPRSIVSRESSMRMSAPPPSYGPRLSVRSTNMNIVRSPFDDPEDDDNSTSETPPSPIIITADEPHVRDMEEMSEVSELSYQEEPTEPRSSV